ncbi:MULTISPECIES: hypothetical protein [unclassified Streptomyces]|uniref:hypothetical protein n=1 Tax=Streptomyces sp. NPDC059980 TaxID=3347022 RepID=UPI0036A5C30A
MLDDEACTVCAAFRAEAEVNRRDLGDLLQRVQLHEREAHRDQYQTTAARTA